jgi:hypothetical protein
VHWNKFICLLFMIVCMRAWAADEFDNVRCGTDIAKAMIGRHSSNERVATLENRHRSLGLKDIGGIEISDHLFLVSWHVCGNEYAELIGSEKQVVLDVLAVPAHSLHSPESFIEECRVGGKGFADSVIAILINPEARKPKANEDYIMLPAKMAWRIDEGAGRFVSMQTQGLSCSVSGSSDDFTQASPK